MATEENCKKILMVRLWADPKLKAGLQNWSQKKTEHKALRCEKKNYRYGMSNVNVSVITSQRNRTD